MSRPFSRRTLLLAAGGAAAVALAGCATGGDDTAGAAREFEFTEPTPAATVIAEDQRAPAPAFSGELLDGTAFDSSSLTGDVVVINFWGSWCVPCRVETPEFQAVHADVTDRGAQFLGVDVKDQRQLAIAFVERLGVAYPSVFDPRGEVAMAFRGFPANVVPSTILLDRDGRVAAVYTGQVRGEDLRIAVERLLAEDQP
ncbi:TlpA family protein disulfide reductase [Modestobacter sp. VKM Ac-2984]|uniref:TlpA family protein disulfide reductase n=1 Tax=Modestobacter sp. VKM Ac-2984 TaxID=3004138 RepID=UPI0022AAC456|nr:TlpA disulfide reductase family protein [Modestobacter sp. VKM Ac-2984]MCZ2817998.1 TlpA disulfide reductase family protein [Modestobacter sp. VKM Ac-2984]